MNNQPLFKIYNNRKLLSQPDLKHHFMDLKTIHWIRKNKPTFNADPSFDLHLKMNIEKFIINHSKYTPPSEWFFVEKEMDTIHGMRHNLRVAFFTQILLSLRGQENSQNEPNIIRNVLIASFLHDLRRRNDLLDLNHGNRTAKWFKTHIILIEKQFETQFSKEDINEIYYTIYFHNKPYEDTRHSRTERFKKYKTSIDILKTADALDRYRLPNITFWINDKYLSLIPPDNLKKIAFELLISSESNFLDGLSNVESVLSGLKELKKR